MIISNQIFYYEIKKKGHNDYGDMMSIYLQLLLASFFWGSNVIVMKLLLKEIPFLLLAVLRVFFSFFFLAIYMKIKKESFLYHHKAKALVLGFFAIYLNFFLTFKGMNQVKGIDNAFLNALSPAFTFVMSFFLLKEKGNKYDFIAINLSVFAFLLSIHFQIFSIQIGFWYLLLGMILYMLANVLVQKWELHQSLSLSLYQLFFGFFMLLVHYVSFYQFSIEDIRKISFLHWVLFLLISGIGFAYIQVIYMKAIKEIGAFQTSFFLSLNPLITYLESLLILKETFDWFQFFAFLLLAYAIYLMKIKSPALVKEKT